MHMRLALVLHLAAALVPHQSARGLRRVATAVATENSAPDAQAKRPSRDRRLTLAVEALEKKERDDVAAVAARVDGLRAMARGNTRNKMDGLRARLDTLGAPAVAAPPLPDNAAPKAKPKAKAKPTAKPKAPAKKSAAKKPAAKAPAAKAPTKQTPRQAVREKQRQNKAKGASERTKPVAIGAGESYLNTLAAPAKAPKAPKKKQAAKAPKKAPSPKAASKPAQKPQPAAAAKARRERRSGGTQKKAPVPPKAAAATAASYLDNLAAPATGRTARSDAFRKGQAPRGTSPKAKAKATPKAKAKATPKAKAKATPKAKAKATPPKKKEPPKPKPQPPKAAAVAAASKQAPPKPKQPPAPPKAAVAAASYLDTLPKAEAVSQASLDAEAKSAAATVKFLKEAVKGKNQPPNAGRQTKPSAPKKARQTTVAVAGGSVKGTVVSTTSYGAFVRIDGTKEDSKPALLHVSEISDGRVMDVAKTLPVGSRVDATVLSVDASKGFRVSLSTKVQRKLKRKDPFVSTKPVAKALKNLPGAPPPTAALRLEKLADELSLDDLDALIESSQKKKKKKKAYVPRQKEAVQEEALSPTSLMSAFQSKEGAAAQKRQEFEMLMQDVVYESGSSLTDLRLLQGLQNKKKKGQNVYATGFWTKLFKPPPKGPKPAAPPSARPQAPPSDDAGA